MNKIVETFPFEINFFLCVCVSVLNLLDDVVRCTASKSLNGPVNCIYQDFISAQSPRPERCPMGEFYSTDEDECISCFCMGIPADNEGTPTQCQSANLPKSLAKVEFYDDTRGFSLANEDFTSEISELKTNPRERELYFDEIEDLEEYVSKNLD